MSAPSDEEYELLPTQEDHRHTSARAEKRRAKGGHPWPLRRVMRRHPILIFCTSFVFVILASTFLAYDIVYLKAKLAIAGSYNAFLTHLWPVGLPNRTDVWENENSKAMHSLIGCMSADNCLENQASIVLLSSPHFANSISGHVSGEDIWAMSVLDAVRDLGYTPIFTTNNEELARTYRQYPDLVKIIIVEGSSARSCFADSNCIKTAAHPLGIPAWKMFSFHFWGGASNPLGNAWTLSPENYATIQPHTHSEENVYLGYSIENTCLKIPVTPIAERPRQAYVLAKRSDYFYEKEYAWPDIVYEPSPVDVALVAGIAQDDAPDGAGVPAGIANLGRLNKTEFYRHLGRSRALVGIGVPFLSPSPYDALCMGLPFINPVMLWDWDDPQNRTKWATQHDGLKFQIPPYVYHVKKGDLDGFWEALLMAVETPIERYIVPEMTTQALRYRVSNLIEGNWREKAERLLNDRIDSGEGDLFEL